MLSVVQFIRQITPLGGMDDSTDGQLLERFIGHQDEIAFATLLRRHGPLVFAVCRRALPTVHDAEDAFQATFLVLARNAGSIAKRGSVASWLHGVARRIARRVKADLVKRRAVEGHPERLLAPDSLGDLVWQDLRILLDDEISRLPEKYRAAFVLCYMEGKTNDEAARLLGCPRGTVSSRLVRAREILRARLSRRGLALSAAFVTTMLTRTTAAAAVSGKLIAFTARAALQVGAGQFADAGLLSAQVVTLTEGVLKAMAMTKLKVAALLLSLGVAIAGAGAVTLNQGVAKPAPVAAENGKKEVHPEPAEPPEPSRKPDPVTAESFTDPVDKYLRPCEKRLTSLDSFIAQVKRTSVDKTFQVTEVYGGTVKYLKPDLSALELCMHGNPRKLEKYIKTGKFLYEYDSGEKEIRVHQLPFPKFEGWLSRLLGLNHVLSGLSEPGFFPFSPLMKAEEVKRRCHLKLVKEDQWYIYIEFQPRTREAQSDFRRGRLVLTRQTYLPREVWLELPNGNEVKWDIPRIEENVPLPRKEFTEPQVPPGWKLKRAPALPERGPQESSPAKDAGPTPPPE
jgi:TIGR03009 family protein